MNRRTNKLFFVAIGLAVFICTQRAWSEQPSPGNGTKLERLQRSKHADDVKHSQDNLPVGTRNLEDRKIGDKNAPARQVKGYLNTIIALAVVVGLIFAVRVLIRRTGRIRPSAGGANQPIQVVTRTAIGARQQLLLVRLGERMVLVGQTTGALTALSEITDPQQVAQLLKTIETHGAGTFGKLLRRNSAESEQPTRTISGQDDKQ